MEYLSDPKSLTEDEIERLIHEASNSEIKILENMLATNDPVLTKIIKKKSQEISSGLKIYL